MANDWFKPWGDCVKDGVATLDCIPIVFSNLLTALLFFFGLALLIIFLLWAFKFMNSSGDAKKVEAARVTFVYGLIGAAIILASFLIIRLIADVTGAKCITVFGFGGCQ